MADFNFITLFPKVMPIRFYPEIDPTDPNYNFVQFDQKAYKDTAMPWQTNKPYTQKCTLNDEVAVMVHIQDNEGDSTGLLEIYNNDNKLIATVDGTHYKGRQVITGNNDINPETGVVTPLASLLYVFKFSEYFTYVGTIAPMATPLNGMYTLRFKNYSGSSDFDSQYYRSEPIMVYSEFPNTMLIKARNSTNRAAQNQFIIDGWVTTDGEDEIPYIPEVQMRVEAHIEAYNPKGIYGGYLQQEYLALQTTAQNFRTFKLVLGSVMAGVPAYMYEKVSEQVICDYFSLDGKAFIFDNESNDSGIKQIWKNTDPGTSPLVWAELPIRERFINQNTLRITLPVPIVPMWRSPWKDPDHGSMTYMSNMVVTFIFGSGGSGIYFAFPTKVFYTEAEELAWINEINTLWLPSYGMGGDVHLDANNFWAYFPLPGENPALPADPFVLYKYLIVKYRINSPGAATVSLPMGLYTSGTGTTPSSVVGVDWQDGGVYSVGFGSAGSSFSPSRNYAAFFAPVDAIIYIFNNDYIRTMQFEDASLLGLLKSFAGDAPLKIQNFFVENAQALTLSGGTMDLPVPGLPDGDAFLDLIISNTHLAELAGGDILTQNYPNMTTINLSKNNLSSVAVDQVFIRFVANTPSRTPGGSVTTKSQTPPAAPTVASAAARATLISEGWTLLHD